MATFTWNDLHELADVTALRHGEQYVGAVTDLHERDDGVSATVHGTEPYRVALYLRAGRLTGECDCAQGLQGDFCKHCVAVGLAHLDRNGDATAGGGTVPAVDADLASGLRSLTRGELVEILLAAAKDDPALHHRLTHEALSAGHRSGRPWGRIPSRAGGSSGWAGGGSPALEVPPQWGGTGRPEWPGEAPLDVPVMRRQIEEALRVRSLVDYQGGVEYARMVADAVARLRGFDERGHHAEVAELAATVVLTVAAAARAIDDSSGAVATGAADAARLHAAACTASPPDPVFLADWLLTFQLARHETPRLDVRDYREALGPEGLAAYASALRERWRREHDRRAGARFRAVARLMERLAVVQKDTDTLVEVLGVELSDGGVYLRIAAALAEACRDAEALAWAERGVREVAGPMDERLADFVAARYAADGRTDDVLTLRRDQFHRSPGVATYVALRADALTADADGQTWHEDRAWALDVLRSEARLPSRWEWERARRLTLIDVLLWEADHDPRAGDEAWQAAHEVGATSAQWIALADHRAAAHPAEAASTYRREVDVLVAEKRNESYARAAELARRIVDLFARTGRAAEARAYVAHLRTRYRARRNFMAELARRGL